MNREELIDAVKADLPDVTKKSIDDVLTATILVISDAIAAGDRVTIVGFGSLEPRKRQARTGRNPRTGEEMQIPAKTVTVFSAGKVLKEKVAQANAVK